MALSITQTMDRLSLGPSVGLRETLEAGGVGRWMADQLSPGGESTEVEATLARLPSRRFGPVELFAEYRLTPGRRPNLHAGRSTGRGAGAKPGEAALRCWPSKGMRLALVMIASKRSRQRTVMLKFPRSVRRSEYGGIPQSMQEGCRRRRCRRGIR